MRREVVNLLPDPARYGRVEFIEISFESRGRLDPIDTAHLRQPNFQILCLVKADFGRNREGQAREEIDGLARSPARPSEVLLEFFPRPCLARNLLSPSLTKPAQQGGVVKDKKIFEGVVQFVQRFAGAKELIEQFGGDFHRLAHTSLHCLRYRRFAPGARGDGNSPRAGYWATADTAVGDNQPAKANK